MVVKAPEPKVVRPLTMAELARLRKNIAEWECGGVRRRRYLSALLDVMLGTGIRISELVALRWENVDLEAGRLLIDSHIVWNGEAWEAVESTKAHSDDRRMALPAFAVAALREMETARVNEFVFPNPKGTSHANPATTMNQWGQARGDEFSPWCGTHTLRKTVAALIAAAAGIESAGGQLGHKRLSVTERYYVPRTITEVPDLTGLLQKLAA